MCVSIKVVDKDIHFVKFKLDEKVLALDEGAWVVNVKNTRDIGQADGEVKLSFK